jgi:hypothetical protein
LVIAVKSLVKEFAVSAGTFPAPEPPPDELEVLPPPPHAAATRAVAARTDTSGTFLKTRTAHHPLGESVPAAPWHGRVARRR